MQYKDYDLSQQLPAEALVVGNAVWSRYRQYPVFSRQWLRGRTLLSCPIIAACAALIGFGMGIVAHSFTIGLLMAALQLIFWMFITCTGPALATYIRYRPWPAARQRKWIIVAILGCTLISWPIDQGISAIVTQLHPLQSRYSVPAFSTTIKTFTVTINALVRLALYTVLGGGLALRAYLSEQQRWREHQRRTQLETARAQAHEADLRLGVLQAQVEPHFLFNTLASIRVLIEPEPRRAAATLDALVAFLRATIPKLRPPDGTAHATLGQQLDICRSYLELMQVRMGERLHYVFDVDAQLLSEAFPAAILITLVENAIKHGIEPKPGSGFIEVRAHQQTGQLLIQVLDNGVGLRPGLGTGVGLANVREQLANRFGTRAQLCLRTLPDQRTCAEILVPRLGA